MADLPIACPEKDCGRVHWSVSGLINCECRTLDRYGYEKGLEGES